MTTETRKLPSLKKLVGAMAISGLFAGAMAATASDEKTVEDHISDGWKEGKAETLFLVNPHLNNFKIDAEVNGKSMVLKGVVEEAIDRDLAEAIAYNIDGIDNVENLIVVNPDPKVANKDIENLKEAVNDVRLLTVVKSKLVKNPHVAGFSIDVDADHGTVTLTGVVDSEETKDLAKWLALSTNGVTDVENKLVVDASEAS
jgi:hyperosmotically inducible periplasmic protein